MNAALYKVAGKVHRILSCPTTNVRPPPNIWNSNTSLAPSFLIESRCFRPGFFKSLMFKKREILILNAKPIRLEIRFHSIDVFFIPTIPQPNAHGVHSLILSQNLEPLY